MKYTWKSYGNMRRAKIINWYSSTNEPKQKKKFTYRLIFLKYYFTISYYNPLNMILGNNYDIR